MNSEIDKDKVINFLEHHYGDSELDILIEACEHNKIDTIKYYYDKMRLYYDDGNDEHESYDDFIDMVLKTCIDSVGDDLEIIDFFLIN